MKKSQTILANTMLTGVLVLQGVIGEAQNNASQKMASDETIRPFNVHVSDAQLADLRQRILATRWPDKEAVDE